MADLQSTLDVAASGMRAQRERIRIVAENVANAESASGTQQGQPYQRKTIFFKSYLDKETGATLVQVDKIGVDDAPFKKAYSPAHPLADGEGYIMMPNVNAIIEMNDMREAQRSYEANLSVIEMTKTMMSRTLDVMGQ